LKLLKALPWAALILLAACGRMASTTTTSSSPSTSPAASTTPTQKAVATVNGTDITRDMYEYYVRNTAGKASTELTADQRNQLLDNLVRGEIVAQEAQKQGLDQNSDTRSLLTLSRLQILEQAGAEHYLQDKKPTDAELQAEYKDQVDEMPKTQLHARHILVANQAEAQQIIDQLKKGAKFDDLAKKESIDPGSKTQGGDLGWFSPSNMVKPFADAVSALKKGEYTQQPVQTQYGWHVIQLLETRETPVPPFDQVKDRVTQLVQQKKFKAYQDELLKTAKVDKNTL
jgi:peptidyl-prolyl cis-trans isomerase C